MGVPVKNLLSIYRLRQQMQEEGTTNPPENVKAFTRELVAKLSELNPDAEIDIITVSGSWKFMASESREEIAKLVLEGEQGS